MLARSTFHEHRSHTRTTGVIPLAHLKGAQVELEKVLLVRPWVGAGAGVAAAALSARDARGRAGSRGLKVVARVAGGGGGGGAGGDGGQSDTRLGSAIATISRDASNQIKNNYRMLPVALIFLLVGRGLTRPPLTVSTQCTCTPLPPSPPCLLPPYNGISSKVLKRR